MDRLTELRMRLGNYEKRVVLEEYFNLELSLFVLSRKQQIHHVTLYSWKMILSITDKSINIKDYIEEIIAEMERLREPY
ncbi:hypothetical protein [Silvanigrella sp.]|jgi:hypothetical protein|uniref:hypothetical protein n=1 Tax=Silvanigrella sp. TaxID=2024976 RepID=UPI0037C93CEA